MWDLPRPGLEPVSPALAGRFSTTAPPGKPRKLFFYYASFPVPDSDQLEDWTSLKEVAVAISNDLANFKEFANIN